MPNASIDCFKLKLQFFNFTISRQTITGYQDAIELCIKLHIGKDFKYLYFAFQGVEKSLIPLSNNPLQFVKELTSAEYEEMEDSFQCYICRVHYKSLKKFSLEHKENSTIRSKYGIITVNKVHEVNF